MERTLIIAGSFVLAFILYPHRTYRGWGNDAIPQGHLFVDFITFLVLITVGLVGMAVIRKLWTSKD